ncbi:uncharacterized protein LOC110842910 [Folsomia candida]|uniref:uncharacterized protein LOC110842910 n=1 Tax=Folsomia candida TaxID=158441 RepID=UPI001604DCA9|nr:uncharacterized protein LOC110842910 [Folsomia candida]XP_035704303.1 uncharacterized protein LOC110842910 [Folsomia candida]
MNYPGPSSAVDNLATSHTSTETETTGSGTPTTARRLDVFLNRIDKRHTLSVKGGPSRFCRLSNDEKSKRIDFRKITTAESPWSKIDKNGDQWKCQRCRAKFANLRGCLYHEYLICKVKYTKQQLSKKSVTIKECKICKKEFNNTRSLKNHASKHTSEIFTCPNGCNTNLKSLASLQTHLSRNFCMSGNNSKCPVCEMECADKTIICHLQRGHIPHHLKVFSMNASKKPVLRDQTWDDRLHINKGGLRVLYVYHIYNPISNEIRLCVGATKYWDVSKVAWEVVNVCIKNLKENERNPTLELKKTACSVRILLREGWIALPDLAFRLPIYVTGTVVAAKLRAFERNQISDTNVINPDDLDKHIRDHLGENLTKKINEVRELFIPTIEEIRTTRQASFDFVQNQFNRKGEIVKHQHRNPFDLNEPFIIVHEDGRNEDIILSDIKAKFRKQ